MLSSDEATAPASSYDDFADAYSAQNETGLFNAYYNKPEIVRLAGDVSGRRVAIDLNQTHTISLFGVQGGGKSYTLGTIAEMALLRSFMFLSRARNSLPARRPFGVLVKKRNCFGSWRVSSPRAMSR